MSLSSRLRVAAIGIGLVTLALLSIAWLQGQQRGERHYKPRSSYAGANQQYDNFSGKVQDGPVAPVRPFQNPPPNPKPNRDEWRQENTLEAQVWQTHWAFLTTVAAFIGLLISGVGILLIKRTLDATWAAVREAEKATKAAEAAVIETGKIGRAQVRAYLSCEGGSYTVSKDHFSCRARLRNHGQSPALLTDVKASLFTSVKGHDYAVESKPFTCSGPAIQAGGVGTVSAVILLCDAMGEGAHKEIFGGGIDFEVCGIVIWRDVFGDVSTQHFKLRPDLGGGINPSANPRIVGSRTEKMTSYNQANEHNEHEYGA